MGRDGDFDQIVSSSIIRAQKSFSGSNSCHICVLPYKRKEYIDNVRDFENYYNEVEICDFSSISYPKAAIQIRNKTMVDRSDLIVFYVEREIGGAYQTMRYAKKQGKAFMNLADNLE